MNTQRAVTDAARPDHFSSLGKAGLVAGVVLLLLWTGCAHKPANRPGTDPQPAAAAQGGTDTAWAEDADNEFAAQALTIADPLEPWNRAMFTFNDRLYFWVLKPVAQVYRAVIPEGLRLAFADFFYNLATPIRVVNNLLQGKPVQAGAEIGRFVLNSTAGVLGLGNPAKHIEVLNPPEEDLGQTFGTYGIGHGIYLVWPILGPSSLRDTVGFAGDGFLSPVSYIEPSWIPASANGLKAVNATSLKIGDYESFKAAAVEPYFSMRDAYLQLRKKKVSE